MVKKWSARYLKIVKTCLRLSAGSREALGNGSREHVRRANFEQIVSRGEANGWTLSPLMRVKLYQARWQICALCEHGAALGNFDAYWWCLSSKMRISLCNEVRECPDIFTSRYLSLVFRGATSWKSSWCSDDFFPGRASYFHLIRRYYQDSRRDNFSSLAWVFIW